MYIIGLCGTSGSGKSLASDYFSKLGILSIEADRVYKDLLYPNSPLICELKAEFGGEIITDGGELNRKRLASIVFSDEGRATALPRLNAVTHAAIIKETERRICELEGKGAKAVIFDAPQLFESGFDKRCDFIIGIGADEKTRISRIVNRDGISEQEAKLRIRSQLSNEFFIKSCSVFVENNGTEQELYEKLKLIYEKIKKEI